jgi:chloramphenicol-sensitive protein RarD
MSNKVHGKGFFFAILGYTLWGLLPLYWRLLSAIASMHIMAFRILLSLASVGIVLLLKKNYKWLAIFREPKKAGFLILAGLLLSFNWGLYIWAVNRGNTLQASLGYYINPLISIVLGLLFFKERLRLLQWAAVAVAFVGVLILSFLSGTLPWISLGLALAFGFYGFLKKKVSLSALESLGAETLASAPLGLLLFCFSFNSGPAAYSGLQGLKYLSAIPVHVWVLLAFSGAASSTPLYFFARGVKLLPLSSLGFLQFISPTINFVLGLWVFGETFPSHYFAAFICIWIAVILYVISLGKGKG